MKTTEVGDTHVTT